MSREQKTDFDTFLKFIKSYKILVDDTYKDSILKSIHKHYFSLLTLREEIQFNKCMPSPETKKNDIFFIHFNECFSEFGSAIFLISNGCYKAAQLTMRSCIENYIKSVSIISVEDANQEKSVFELFEIAKNTPFFKFSELHSKHYQTLKSMYAELCCYTHTAHANNTQKITSLGDFPYISMPEATIAKDNYNKLSSCFIESCLLLFMEKIHSFNFRNKDIIFSCVGKETKLFISTSESVVIQKAEL